MLWIAIVSARGSRLRCEDREAYVWRTWNGRSGVFVGLTGKVFRSLGYDSEIDVQTEFIFLICHTMVWYVSRVPQSLTPTHM